MQLTEFTLRNGLRVFVVPDETCTTSWITVHNTNGCREDHPDYLGEHHALEHMLFRGTQRFPNRRELLQTLERYNMTINGMTNPDTTRYSADPLPEHFADACERLADMVFAPLLRAEDWEIERETIRNELFMSRNQTNRISFRLRMNHIYPNCPQLICGAIGTETGINAITAERLRLLHEQNYTPKDIILAIAGKLPADFKDILEQTFGVPQPAVSNLIRIPEPHPVLRYGSLFRLKHNAFQNPVLVYQQIFPRVDARTIMILGIVCGMAGHDGLAMSSPLFQRLREEQHLFYSFDLSADHFNKSYDMLTFKCDLTGDNPAVVIEAFWDVIRKVVHDTNRFTFMKDKRHNRYKRSRFSPKVESEDLVDCFMYGIPYMSREELKIFRDTVTIEEIQAIAQKYFQPERFCADIFCKE